MQRAIRLMVCVALAATSVAAFANTGGESESYDTMMQGENDMQPVQSQDETRSAQGQEEIQPMDRADDGHGSGEPALSSATAATSPSAETALLGEKTAIREHNQREFVQQTWTAAP